MGVDRAQKRKTNSKNKKKTNKMKRKLSQITVNKSPNNFPPKNHSFKSWNVKKVQNWLNDIGLEDYGTFFQSSNINGGRLSKITSDFLDSIGMLNVDKTVFYIELQKLHGKSVKTRKVVTITDRTHVIFRDNGTLVVKTGPEVKKVEILRHGGKNNDDLNDFGEKIDDFHDEQQVGFDQAADKHFLMDKYLEDSCKNCDCGEKRAKTRKSGGKFLTGNTRESKSAGKSIWNGMKNATMNAFHETSREFMEREVPDNAGPPKTQHSSKFRVENISPACDFPIVHGLW